MLQALNARGALFFQELVTQTDLLPGHVEEALRELAALGLERLAIPGATRDYRKPWLWLQPITVRLAPSEIAVRTSWEA